MEMTRRSFVGAAGAVAATAAVAAGVTPSSALAEDKAFAKDEFEGETANIPPVEPPASYDYEADIVVVGAGGGLSGALRALDLGASAIVIEKLPMIGGETQEACVFAFTSGNQCQLDAGLPDVTDTLLQKFYGSIKFGKKWVPFIDNVTQGTKDLIAWTTEKGFEWEPGECVGEEKVYAVCPKGSAVGMMNERSMKFYTDWLGEQIEAQGGQILLSTEAEALIMDDGAVVGVQCTDADGNTVNVKANKAALMSTNGICGNQAMLAKYCPDALRCKYSSAGAFADGKGIRMGFGAGAEFGGYNQYGIFDGGLNKKPWETYLYDPATQLVRQPWLGIDVNGDRYPYDTTALGGFTSQGMRLRDLPGNQGYVIFDDNYEEYALGFNQLMCRIPMSRKIFGDELDRAPEYLQDWESGARAAIDEGIIESADTIEELAEKLGLNVDVVVKAVNDYNAIVEAGEDPDGPFAEHPEYLKPIAQPPFHGAAVGAFIYATSAGLATNENMQVVDTKGQPIPGLYATGAAVARDMQVGGSCNFANTSAFIAVNDALK